jgi:hypothetical protein
MHIYSACNLLNRLFDGDGQVRVKMVLGWVCVFVVFLIVELQVAILTGSICLYVYFWLRMYISSVLGISSIGSVMETAVLGLG